MGLKVVISGLVLVYVLAAIASVRELYAQDTFHLFWSISAGFWLFLAVGLLRFSKLARKTTVTLLWSGVLVFIVLSGINTFTHTGLRTVFEYLDEVLARLLAFLVSASSIDDPVARLLAPITMIFSIIALYVLSKHKEDFN